MANIHDNDMLITQSNGNLYLDLKCGYGQPCATTVTLNRNDGSSTVLKKFNGNTLNLDLGSLAHLKYHSIEVYTTIHDVQDNAIEGQDIALDIKVSETKNNFVDTAFTKKTKGKGAKFHSFYTIAII